jgi:D-tyrosyl-tRNA(Tyr) deacylase
MKIVVQRVSAASVQIGDGTIGSIATGLLVFLGIARGDAENDCDYLLDKAIGLRIFPDDAGKMNLDIRQANGSLLIVSQFTLYADCRRGRRPSFDRAAPPELAVSLYDYFVAAARRSGVPVQTGTFQAHMRVSLINEGPVTVVIDSEERTRK